jgi:quercetin dioxygenase-like cupin family protein
VTPCGRPASTAVRFEPMEARDLRDLVQFGDAGPRHETLFESDRLWSEVVCLDRNQSLGPISDVDSDAIVLVVAGKVVLQLDRGRKRREQWEAALVPAGVELTITNATDEGAVVLIVAAPPPPRRPAVTDS